MAKKAKKAKVARKKSAKKSARKSAAKKSTKKSTRKSAKKSAKRAVRRFCFLITADPNFVERCEVGPDGRCNLNCTIIPISQVPGSARVRMR